jgi:hypothetical protein
VADLNKEVDTIHTFHLEMHVFEMVGGPNTWQDKEYGLVAPIATFQCDHVPIALCASFAWSINEKEVNMVWNSVDLDDKCFCTLNLMIPMEVEDDLSNLPKPHLVFKGSQKRGEDWADASECEAWHKGVHVSFQEKAWVDAKTNLYGLCKFKEDIIPFLEQHGLKGV